MSFPQMQPLFDYEEATMGNLESEAYTGRAMVEPRAETLAPVIVLPRQEYQPRVLEDRWYQSNALADIEARLPLGGARRGGKGECLVCPTGGGKTSIASRAIGRWLESKKRVLILVDLERLLDQMRDDLAEEGIYPLIEKAEHSALADFGRHGNCVLASMQTLHTSRLQKWDADSFDYIVIDECHCFGYERIINFFQKAQYLGLTATPLRADGRSLKEFFRYPYIGTLTMREAIEGYNRNTNDYEKPFLSRIELLPIDASHIDLTGIKIVGRDFDSKELDRRIWEHTNWLATAILAATPDMPTWIYCPKIATAEAISKALRDLGAKAAPYHSKIADPASTFRRFERGELQYLTNVNMLIKGVNVPKVAAIVRVRASLNVAQATQEIGRGTRLSPQTGKTACRVVEFGFKSGKRLGGVLDSILDGADEDENITPEERTARAQVRERAEKIVSEGQERDVLKALERAKKQLSAEEEERRRARDEEKQAKYQKASLEIDWSKKYDPFAGLDKQGAQSSQARAVAGATGEQMAQLETLSGGVIKAARDAKQWCEESAAQRIRDLEIRAKHKYASERQLRMMIDTLGFDPKPAQRMRKWEASQAIEARMMEMACDIEDSGKSGKTYEQLKEMKPWELSPLHKRLCGADT